MSIVEDYYFSLSVNNISNNLIYIKQLNESIYFDCNSGSLLTYCRRNIMYYLYGYNLSINGFQNIGIMTINNLSSDLISSSQNNFLNVTLSNFLSRCSSQQNG